LSATPAEASSAPDASAAAAPPVAVDNSYLPDKDRQAATRQAALPPQIISTTEEIKAAQEHLKYMGYDVPAATGIIDTRTKVAIRQFQGSIGATQTGALTVEQLQLLFQKAAARDVKHR
jgi:peptidoglycan hydrolase-like protein with peptidoglycan-binding domain